MILTKAYQYQNSSLIFVTLEPIMPAPDNMKLTEATHICAEQGKILTNGEIFTSCINTVSPELWQEVDAPIYEDID